MKMFRRGSMTIFMMVGVLVLSACGSSGKESVAESSIAENVVTAAAAAEGLTTVVKLIKAADLVETLSGTGPFTVFAPADYAFDDLPDGVVDALLLPENKALLVKILTYHVIPGKFLAAEVTPGEVVTLEGQKAQLDNYEGACINHAHVVSADFLANNGVVHAIDAVVIPPDVSIKRFIKK